MSLASFLVGIFCVCACVNGQSIPSIYWSAKVDYVFSNTGDSCSSEFSSEELIWVVGIGSTTNSVTHSKCIVKSGSFGTDFPMTVDPLNVSGKTTTGVVNVAVLGWESDGCSGEDVDGGVYPTSSCSYTLNTDDCYESSVCFYSLPYASTESDWKTKTGKCCTSGGWCANFIITYKSDFCSRNINQCGVGGTCVNGNTVDAYGCTCTSGYYETYTFGRRTCTEIYNSPTPLPTGGGSNPTPLPTGGGSTPNTSVLPGYIRVTDFPQENCAGTGVSASFKGDMSCQSFQGTYLKGSCSDNQATLFLCEDTECADCTQVSIVAEGNCGYSLAGGSSSSYICGTQVNAGSFVSPGLFALVAVWVNMA